MAGLALSAGLPVWITHSESNGQSSPWQKAVYRFDTGALISCEAFAREIAQRPSPSVGIPAEDQWERIPPNSPPVNVLPHCLLQAGLMAL